MTSGVRKDGKPNPSHKLLPTGTDRKNIRMIGLPLGLLTNPKKTMEIGLQLVEDLKILEQQYTEWEDQQDPQFLALLPWAKERLMYREQKALGTVKELTWCEALHGLEEMHPYRLGHDTEWGLYDYSKLPSRQKLKKQAQASSEAGHENPVE